MPRQVARLVETTFAPTRRMEGHWHDRRHALQNVRSAGSHQLAERTRERSSCVVLQRVDDRAQGPVIRANRPRSTDAQPRTLATATDPERAPEVIASRWPDSRIAVESRKRIAARIADRRCQRENGGPAGTTDRAAGGIFERRVTRGARRCQNDDGESVDGEKKRVGQPAGESSTRSALPQSRSRP